MGNKPSPALIAFANGLHVVGRDGYESPVVVCAAKLRKIIEATRGTSLIDKPAKLDAWRNGSAKTDTAKFPIELVFNDAGQLDVNDGRHRIALAAERSQNVLAYICSADVSRLAKLTA